MQCIPSVCLLVCLSVPCILVTQVTHKITMTIVIGHRIFLPKKCQSPQTRREMRTFPAADLHQFIVAADGPMCRHGR